MKEIEKGIHEIHAQAREQKENQKQTHEEKTVEGLYLKHVSKMTFIIFLLLKSYISFLTEMMPDEDQVV